MAVGAALAGVALATPPSGVLIRNDVVRAGFVDPVDIKFKMSDGRSQVIHVPEAQETVIPQIVLSPGGQSGWHSHPVQLS